MLWVLLLFTQLEITTHAPTSGPGECSNCDNGHREDVAWAPPSVAQAAMAARDAAMATSTAAKANVLFLRQLRQKAAEAVAASKAAHETLAAAQAAAKGATEGMAAIEAIVEAVQGPVGRFRADAEAAVDAAEAVELQLVVAKARTEVSSMSAANKGHHPFIYKQLSLDEDPLHEYDMSWSELVEVIKHKIWPGLQRDPSGLMFMDDWGMCTLYSPDGKHQCMPFQHKLMGRRSTACDGYARVYFMGNKVYAHMLVCHAFNGPCPPPQEPVAEAKQGPPWFHEFSVCHHTCGSRSCLNPFHLQWKRVANHTRDHKRDEHYERGRGGRFKKGKGIKGGREEGQEGEGQGGGHAPPG